jgi:type II secretory pathway pseudopilin PulG
VKRLPAFTLTEIIVVMIISGLSTGFLYWSYLTVQGYYLSLSAKQDRAIELSELFFQLKKDVGEADWIIKSEDGIKCLSAEKISVTYSGTNAGLKRVQGSNVDFILKDTFLIRANQNVIDSSASSLVTKIRLYFRPTRDSIILIKEYTPSDLYNWTYFNGN